MINIITYINLNDLLSNNLNYTESIYLQYFTLLNQLTIAPIYPIEEFLKNINKIFNFGIIIIGYIGSFELNTFEIIATGTILIEPKIIRNGLNVGHIEDIVVKSTFRGKNISQKILDMLKLYGQQNNCYKIILDCSDYVVKVYQKNGFNNTGHQMSIYLEQ